MNIGDRIDYKVWTGEDYRWKTGVIERTEIAFNHVEGISLTFYYIREKDEYVKIISTDAHKHDESRFIDTNPSHPICYQWEPCDDSNYWIEVPGYATIVSISDNVYTQQDCPYGWSTLIKCGAKLMNIEV